MTNLTPIVRKVCEGPKFSNGNTDAEGVAHLVLLELARQNHQKKTKRKRRLFDTSNKDTDTKRRKESTPDSSDLLPEVTRFLR